MEYACVNNNLEVLKKLTECKGDVTQINNNEENLLCSHLTKNCNKELVMYLIENKCELNITDVNSTPFSPFMVSCRNKDSSPEFLNFLIDLKANPNFINRDDQNSLHFFCDSVFNSKDQRNFDIFKYLVSSTPDIDSLDAFSNSALLYCAKFRPNEYTQYLIEKGSNRIGDALLGYIESDNPTG